MSERKLWTIHEGDDYIVVLRPGDETTEHGIRIDNIEDAVRIVRAVNAHDDLLEICKALLPHAIGHSVTGCKGTCDVCRIRNTAAVVIDNAKKTP
jgi:hypothetical protein